MVQSHAKRSSVCASGGAAMPDFMKKYGQEWRFASEHNRACLCNCSPALIKTGALQQYSRRTVFFFTFPWPPVIFKAANICNNARGTLFLFIRSPKQPTAAVSVRCIHSLSAKQKLSIIHHSTASVCKYSPAD